MLCKELEARWLPEAAAEKGLIRNERRGNH